MAQQQASAEYINDLLYKRIIAGKPVSHRLIAVAADLKPQQPHRARLEAAMALRMATPKAK